MTTTSIARIEDMARMTCGGALDGPIRLALFNTLKEFFQRSDCWLLELLVDIVPTSNDYQINTGQNVAVNRLMCLERPNSPPTLSSDYLPTVPPQFLPVVQPVDQPYSEAQNPLFRVRRSGVLLNAGSKTPILRIAQNPSAEEVWVATLALNICDPTDADGFPTPPDWLMERYLSYLAAGVISQLMLQAGKPYSSRDGASFHGRKFNEGVGLARTETRRMFTYGSQRWAFPQGWNAPRTRLPSSFVLP